MDTERASARYSGLDLWNPDEILDALIESQLAAVAATRAARPALERAGRLADGWVTSSRIDLSRISEGISVVRSAAGEAGRDPDSIRIVCRGVVRAGAPVTVPEGGGRVLLSGSYADIRGDVEWLAERGVTEVFYDLNWDPLVGAPDVDPAGAAARAGEILEGLAPDR